LRLLFAIAAVQIILVSCAPRIVHVDMNRNGTSSTVGQLLKEGPNHIVVDSVRDARSEQELLGKFQYVTIYGNNFTQWIESRFNELQTGLAKVQNDLNSIHITASVTKAYIRRLPSTLGASVVIDVNISCGYRIEQHRLYRGDTTTVNWAFGPGEVRGLLNDAVSMAMGDLVQDIRALCSQS